MNGSATTEGLPLELRLVTICIVVAGLFMLRHMYLSHPDRSFWKRYGDDRLRYRFAFLFFPVTALLGLYSLMTAVLLMATALGFAVLGEMSTMLRHSASDFSNASGGPAKISAIFGWTHSHRIATGQRPFLLSLPILAAAHAMLAIFLLSAVVETLR